MFCPNCGTQLEEDALFCSECGQRIDEPGDEGASEEEQGATQVLESEIDFGDGLDAGDFSDAIASFDESGRNFGPSGVSGGAGLQTTFVAPDGQQPMAFSASASTGVTQAKGGNKTAVAVAIIAIVAVLAVATVAVFMLRPTGGATFSIQYETDGGSAISAVRVEDGSQVTSPANPTKDGYKFAGWYADSALTQSVSFPFTPTGDTILYAKWEEEKGSSEKSNTTITINAPSASATTKSSGKGSTVSVSIVGADGTTRTADIHRSGSSERVLPDSNTRRYSASEVAGLSDAERCIAWNEIIAASNGYAFKNSGLASYFANCSWYSRNGGASPSGSLSSDASANVEMLKNGLSDSWWLNLATV